MEQILTSRRTTLQEMCSKEFNNSVKTKGRAPSFFYSKSAKVACCKAPKTGSSFWGTVVLAIESRKNASDTFHINRNSVHGRNEIDVKKFRNITRESLTLMVSREPYSRLFSAFVDKYFLLGQLGREIQKALKKQPFIMNGGICGYGVTFTDFLNYITDRALRGMELNEHFMPIVKLCDACAIKYDVLSKQESLTKDTEHILDLLKFSDEKKNDIQTSLKKGIKNTIYSLVASYLTDYSKYRTDCPDRVSHFEKVWKTLQVQGYVSTRAAYPAGEFQKMTTFDADTITSLILREMERFPLRKEEKAVQRKSALSIAYADVGPETIAKIQKVYKMDFLLFGYNMTPPDKRPGAITL
ncbi:carbohydrate sulfotransferase 14-like [Ylistrum balloti]|uniref:carbohydrate sulfotransferase 14-like n=1 Tax=Ylistrum balloti TaxID=509963 RepID=UPI002905E443|nr:carbohydrate sulfotransferase 14-like [Ylistrum balloti]